MQFYENFSYAYNTHFIPSTANFKILTFEIYIKHSLKLTNKIIKKLKYVRGSIKYNPDFLRAL